MNLNTQTESKIMPHSMGQKLTMSSLEIAELTGKRHDHVMRDIRNMLDDLSHSPNLGFVCKSKTYKAENGQEYPMYELDRDTTDTLLTGYSAVARMSVIKRWRELENQNTLSLPNFDNPALAARAWAEQYEQRQIAEQQRNQAIREKGQISNSREASVMGKLGQAVKKICRLEEKVGDAENIKQVKAIPWLKDVFYLDRTVTYQQIGKALTRISKEMGLSPVEIEDSTYRTVKGYHIDVIDAFKLELSNNPELLIKYRKA